MSVVLHKTAGPTFAELITGLGSAVKMWWKFEDTLGSTTIADASGNGKTGATGANAWSFRLPSLVGDGYSAAFASDFLTEPGITGPPGLPNPPTTLFVLMQQINAPGNATFGVGGGIGVVFETFGSIQCTKAGGTISQSTVGVTSLGATTFIAITVDAAKNVRVYSDGVLRAGPTAWGAGTPSWSDLNIGFGGQIWFGRIQHLVITDTEIDAATIAQLNSSIKR